jgi:RsbT co-antagonist protein rsbRD N-terminal domain
MNAVPFVLRDHREQLWRRWAESLGEDVAADYRELMNGPLGERAVRAFVDDLIAWSQAEGYEAPGLLRQACERVAADAGYRMSLGFTALDLAMALQALRGAIIDVLLDALVLGELPSFAETLEQVKAADRFIDQLVAAVFTASPRLPNDDL